MNVDIVEAIQKANDFLLRKTGISGSPNFVRLTQRGNRPAWCVSYGAELFFKPDRSGKTIVDGGEFLVTVDPSNGDVSEFSV